MEKKCVYLNPTLVLNVLPRSGSSILEDIRKAIWYNLQVPVHGYLFIYFIFKSGEDEDPKWEELLSLSLGLKYLLCRHQYNKQCQAKTCFQILFSCITLLCFNIAPEIILLQVAVFHSGNSDLSFINYSKMSAWETLYAGSEKAKVPLMGHEGSVQESLQDQRTCLFQGAAWLERCNLFNCGMLRCIGSTDLFFLWESRMSYYSWLAELCKCTFILLP